VEKKTIEQVVISGMMAIMMVVIMGGVAQAAIPQPQYTCPICGEKFWTYDELYAHFTTEHPSEPIEVIWE
jgi:hypothetical protein